ncbi:hypothetical protein QRX60_15795 [Amycolatopsis mongoliensis]|uniref:Lipoprotein n=1 Tax=Amycolatopsis mongoliensis TaxID=715475 RepID=A0A9Y2JV12_9PSEU|nr:hypothetical protein [Amycolatopsis sp. 4-36]WIY05231.1 hypothetical protein QRX60_15795 [Amycolatopsis sp. 4-36]
MPVRPAVVLAFLAVVLAGCGPESASTGRPSADAIIGTVEGFAGKDADVSHINVLRKQAKNGDVSVVDLVIACKPGTRDCLLVAPDGAGYPSLADFVDDTKLLEPGDTISGAAGIPAHPVARQSETVVKSDPDVSAWTAVGVVVAGLVVAALVVIAVVWLIRRPRRRREGNRLLTEWDLPPED